MLRSFDYAAFAALLRVAAGRPDDRGDLEPAARAWRRETCETFLAGYREGIQGCPAYPEDEQVARNLIDLFVLEKALYEINYEINLRPDWLPIPLAGIVALLQDDPDQT